MSLEHYHSPESIQKRLEEGPKHNYIGDFLLGAIDGCVTTFAVVASVAGAHLSASVAIILGVANLIADGFSMAAGNYQNAKADHELIERARRMEERHIDEVPEGEREEIRQIYAAKGFEGETLEEIVRVITSDRKQWVDTMIQEELGLPLDAPNPVLSALTTFLAFLLIGLVPLFPYILPIGLDENKTLMVSSIATGIAFFIVGMIKGKVLHHHWLKSGLETLAIGGTAAILAYAIGYFLRGLIS